MLELSSMSDDRRSNREKIYRQSNHRLRSSRRLAVLIILAILTALAVASAQAASGQSRPETKETKEAKERKAEAEGREGQDPQGVVKVETALVTVPVIITDRFGRFITGLTRNDFSIREDGKVQEITSFSSTEAPFNVALLIDTSHSTQRKLSTIRKAALSFVKQLQPNDRVMIVTFDDQVRFISPLTSDRAELERAIKSVKSNYATSLYDAIFLTISEKLAPLPGRKALVVLTDGVDTASRKATYESALELVSTSGVISYAIQYETRNEGGPVMKPLDLPGPVGNFRSSSGPAAGPSLALMANARLAAPGLSAFDGGWMSYVSGQARQQPQRDRYLIAGEFLRALALQSGARYLRAETIESTSYYFAMIAEELRNQYTLAYYSTNEERDGGLRNIDVQIKYADLVVRARQAYRAPRPDSETPAAPGARTKQ